MNNLMTKQLEKNIYLLDNSENKIFWSIPETLRP